MKGRCKKAQYFLVWPQVCTWVLCDASFCALWMHRKQPLSCHKHWCHGYKHILTNKWIHNTEFLITEVCTSLWIFKLSSFWSVVSFDELLNSLLKKHKMKHDSQFERNNRSRQGSNPAVLGWQYRTSFRWNCSYCRLTVQFREGCPGASKSSCSHEDTRKVSSVVGSGDQSNWF